MMWVVRCVVLVLFPQKLPFHPLLHWFAISFGSSTWQTDDNTRCPSNAQQQEMRTRGGGRKNFIVKKKQQLTTLNRNGAIAWLDKENLKKKENKINNPIK